MSNTCTSITTNEDRSPRVVLPSCSMLDTPERGVLSSTTSVISRKDGREHEVSSLGGRFGRDVPQPAEALPEQSRVAAIDSDELKIEFAKAFVQAKCFEDSERTHVHPFLLYIRRYNPLYERGWLKAQYHPPGMAQPAQIKTKLDEVLVCLVQNIRKGKTGFISELHKEIGYAWDVSHKAINRKLKALSVFNNSLGIIEGRHATALSFGSNIETATNIVVAAASPEGVPAVSETTNMVLVTSSLNGPENKNVDAIVAESKDRDANYHVDEATKRQTQLQAENESLKSEMKALKRILSMQERIQSMPGGLLNYEEEEIRYENNTYRCYLPAHHTVVSIKELNELKKKPSVTEINDTCNKIEQQQKEIRELTKYKEKCDIVTKKLYQRRSLRFSAVTRKFVPLLIEELKCRGYEVGKRYSVTVKGKLQAFDLNEETSITMLKNLLKSHIGCLNDATVKGFSPRYPQLFDACLGDSINDAVAATDLQSVPEEEGSAGRAETIDSASI